MGPSDLRGCALSKLQTAVEVSSGTLAWIQGSEPCGGRELWVFSPQPGALVAAAAPAVESRA